MGGPKAEISAVTVFDPPHFITVHIPASAGLPQLRRLDDGEKEFLGAGGVHFLADNITDFI